MSDADEKTPHPTVHLPWAMQSTVERYHLEDGQWKQEKGTMIQKHQFEIDAIKERLNQGANSFTKMDLRIEELEKAKNPKWQTVLGLFLILAPWIWVAAQYPNQEKFETLQDRVRAMEMNQLETSRDVKDVQKQQDKSDQKIDQILLRLTTSNGSSSSTP
jgi:hypothetical protein